MHIFYEVHEIDNDLSPTELELDESEFVRRGVVYTKKI